MLTPYYLRGKYFAQGLDFVARNQQALRATNYTVVWNTGNWNRSANHPFDIIEIIAGTHFHSQRNYEADPLGYPFIVRGVATGLKAHAVFSIFGIEYWKKNYEVRVRNLVCNCGTRLLIPKTRTQPHGRFQDFYQGLQQLLERNPNVRSLVFQTPIPPEFLAWCGNNQINIEVLQPVQFANLYPETLINDPAQ